MSQSRRWSIAATVATSALLTSVALVSPPAIAVDASASVVINEVYGGGGNTGATIRNDFIELYNPGTAPIDLATWSVQYASSTGTSWSRTNLTGSIPPGKTYVVKQAAGANTSVPEVTGDVTGTIAMSGTSGKVALVNNQGTLPTTCTGIVGATPCSARTDVVDFVGYGTSANDYAGSGATPTLTNSTSASRDAAHTNTANNATDFVAGPPTPCGLACSDTPPPPPPPPPVEMTIAEIQGTGAASPFAGQRVTTRGVVTAAYSTGNLSGYYLQTAGTGGVDDATPAASDAVFVFQPAGTLPARGTFVQVTGDVSEFFGLTEITVAAADVTPLAETPAPVTAVPGTWPATDAEREVFEGMLYRPSGDYTVTNTFQTNQFGEVGLAFGTTPLIQRTELELPGPASQSAVEADNLARRVVLDDGASINFMATVSGALVNGNLTPPYVSNTDPVRVGAPVTFVDDVIVDYRFSLWRFQPTTQVIGPDNLTSPATFGNTRTFAPDDARIGDADVTLGSFNVLNYFTTLGTDSGSCTAFNDRDGNGSTVNSGCDQRGAWDAADFARQQSKIVEAINALGADVVGLMEIENSARLGEPVDEALLSLVAALNADAGSDVWAANPSSADLPLAAGQDVITNAIIYQPAAVTRIGDARALGDQSDNGQAFQNAREPIGQAFAPVAGGDPFFFVVNHFKSKGSAGPWPGDADSGDGQGASNESRVRQATALRDWVPAALPAGVKAVVLAGDFNSYSQEDPLQVLYEAGYANAEQKTGGQEYSYSFSGLSGSLDHVLLNDVASGRLTGADIWDINSGESIALEYSRFNYHGTDFYLGDPFRSSDHDPIVIGLTSESQAIPVQVLATNDFHGRIQANGAEAGAAVLAGAVKQLRDAQPNTVFAAAGDLIGASTFESFIAKDKPTIDALNAAGLEVSSVGNHEFDAGYFDLVDRVMADYDPVTNPQGGAEWEYLGANVRFKDTHDPALPETWTIDFDGIQVGFVGVVTEHLDELVSPDGISMLEIEPIVTATNRGAADLKAAGADLVIMLVHEGASTTSYASATDPATEFGAIVNGVGPEVDAIVSGHTHLAYNHGVPVQEWVDQGRAVTTRPVVSAGQYGTFLNQLLFQVDPETEDVIALNQNVLPLVKNPAYPTDPATKAIVDRAVADAAVLGAAPLGSITGPFNRAKLANGTTENRGGESTLGNLVAEVQRHQTDAQIALMNPGGLRADMIGSNAGGYPAELTYRQAANVQPFANTLVNLTLTGAQLKSVLEQQWQPAGAARPFLRLGTSEGFTYTYDPSAAAGSRIAAMWLDGGIINQDTSYSVTVNSFLAAGGDNFTVLASGTNRRDTGKVDLQAMVDYLAEMGSVSPDYTQRSVGVRFPAGAPAAYATGSTVVFDLSSLAFSTAPDTKDDWVDVTVGNVLVGTFAVNNTIGTAVLDEYGTANISFAVPAGIAAGIYDTVITGTSTGTRVIVPIEVVTATTATTVVSTGSPSVFGAPVTFTATVTGPIAGGSVQFAVDGVDFGDPVPVLSGVAISQTTSWLAAGAHTVVATYSGDAGTSGSTGSLVQAVQYRVIVFAPAANSTVKPNSSVPISFQLTNASGSAISDALANALTVSPCRVSVDVIGAQTLSPLCPNYNQSNDRFVADWRTGKATGSATMRVFITYPGAPTQIVTVPVRITK
jgi:5'-nucleotidase